MNLVGECRPILGEVIFLFIERVSWRKLWIELEWVPVNHKVVKTLWVSALVECDALPHSLESYEAPWADCIGDNVESNGGHLVIDGDDRSVRRLVIAETSSL